MTAVRVFLPSEIVLAVALAVSVEGGIFILLATAQNRTVITAKEDAPPPSIPIEVKPVLDDIPLLKLGGKRVRAKLPDMWVKKPPIRRYEAASAPSPRAEALKEKIPDTPLVKPSAEAPPPDAAIAKKVEPTPVADARAPEKANLDQEGAADGVKEGTETDPLKAFAVSQYRLKIAAWFNARFRRPTAEIPCEELKKLRAGVVAQVGAERTVTGYALAKPSGNEIFGARVRATLDAIVSGAAELPPPPPNYAEVLGASLSVAFFVPSCD